MTGSMANDKNNAVFDKNITEEVALEHLGYEQELSRTTFGLIGMVAFAFSIVTSWSALAVTLVVGIESGGPSVIIYSWVGVSIFTLPVVYSMAEMCSAYPLAGGQYSWVAVLAPKSISRGFAYVCGWFTLIGVIAMGALQHFITANFVLAIANMYNPDYTIQRWHTVLIAYLVALFVLAATIYLPRYLDHISRGMVIWNIKAFFIIIIVILACNDHKQPARFVFVDFINLTGFGKSYAAVIGLLQAAFGMCCYDAPAHMVEELVNGRREGPRAMIWSVYIGAVTGLIFLVAASFCIGDIVTTATSSTGVPIVQVFLDSTASKAAAACLTILLLVIVIGAGHALAAEAGRTVYAFARDTGLPFSNILKRVDKKRQVPVSALILIVGVQMALISIYFGTVTGFNTVVAIATEGFYLSYAMPLLARLLSFVFSEKKHARIPGLYTLGAWSVPMNAIGLLFLVFLSITFNFPSAYPVTSENMNYTSAAVGFVMAIALLFWIMTGRKHFAGPVIDGLVVDETKDDAAMTAGSESEGRK
ncbi:putative GABA permease [Acrodontium crateriforme]|uniref:GABA permease n=1 Tax=Acrodontium crateriforme TaxID=150365 RepID=A0AAQ3M900_9PEZI|nr:putative GABA permease [Acrodontium crateriforme]